MNNKTKIYIIIGVVISFVGLFEWIISPLIFPELIALASWLSFIVFLLGLYFFERAWNENKIHKGELTREEIKKKEMTWKQWALLFIGFILSIVVIAVVIILLIG